jgi:two-component system, cell cycle response regulator CtrA
LELLFLKRGVVLSKTAFLNHLYCGREEAEMKTVDVLICRLRKKLTEAGIPTLIGTVWGCGYVRGDPQTAPMSPGSDSVEMQGMALAA